MKAVNKKYVKIGVAGLAVAALVIGLSVGLTQRAKANKNAAASKAEGMDMGGYDDGMMETCSSTSGKSGKSGGSSGKSGKSSSSSSSGEDGASVDDGDTRRLVVPGTEDYAARAGDAQRRKLRRELARELAGTPSTVPNPPNKPKDAGPPDDKGPKDKGPKGTGAGAIGGDAGDDGSDDSSSSSSGKSGKSGGTSSCGKSGKSGGSSGKSGKSGNMSYSTSSEEDDEDEDCPTSSPTVCIKPKDTCPTTTSSSGKSGKSGGSSGKSGKSGGSSSCGKSGKSGGSSGKSGKSGSMSYSTSSEEDDEDEDCPPEITFCSSSSSGKSGKSGGSSSCGKSGKSGGSSSASCSTSEDEEECTPRPPTICNPCEASKWTIVDEECVKREGICNDPETEGSACFDTAEMCCEKAGYVGGCVAAEDDDGFLCEVRELTCEDSDWTIDDGVCVKLLGICDDPDNLDSGCYATSKDCCKASALYPSGCSEVDNDEGFLCEVKELTCADQKKWFLDGDVCVKDVEECNDGEGSDQGCFNNAQQCCKELTGKPNGCIEENECLVVIEPEFTETAPPITSPPTPVVKTAPPTTPPPTPTTCLDYLWSADGDCARRVGTCPESDGASGSCFATEQECCVSIGIPDCQAVDNGSGLLCDVVTCLDVAPQRWRDNGDGTCTTRIGDCEGSSVDPSCYPDDQQCCQALAPLDPSPVCPVLDACTIQEPIVFTLMPTASPSASGTVTVAKNEDSQILEMPAREPKE